jgi:ATP-dependent Clp protease, protease subunit
MQMIKPDIATFCMGFGASMGAVLLAAGTPGKRFALPNARILIHQGSGGFSGAIPDIEVAAREALTLSAKCLSIISAHTGQPYEKVKRDSDRDYYMTAQDAKDYGIIDEVLEPTHIAPPLTREADAAASSAANR